jgi:ABC-type multidrug transport system fused ATPase/permease subunit
VSLYPGVGLAAPPDVPFCLLYAVCVLNNIAATTTRTRALFVGKWSSWHEDGIVGVQGSKLAVSGVERLRDGHEQQEAWCRKGAAGGTCACAGCAAPHLLSSPQTPLLAARPAHSRQRIRRGNGPLVPVAELRRQAPVKARSSFTHDTAHHQPACDRPSPHGTAIQCRSYDRGVTRDMLPPLLEARGLRREAAGRAVLSGVSFTLQPGDSLFVRGPSGSGKSLLLRAVACLDHLEGGSLLLHGHTPSEVGYPSWRTAVAYVPQSRASSLKGTPAET